jgi:uncharacterized OB-fold protein
MNNPINSWRNNINKYQYLNKIGKVVCLTKIHTATQDFTKYTPYFVGIIEFGNKERISGQIVCENNIEIKINDKVIGILRKGKETPNDGIVEYLVKFKVI